MRREFETLCGKLGESYSEDDWLVRFGIWTAAWQAALRGAACLDCGKPYESFPIDTVLSDEEWRAIHPDEKGVLCANCIVARAAAHVPGIVITRLSFVRAEDYDRAD